MNLPIKLSLDGQELSFDKSEVRLGRTADNDVVVKDPAASRSHARVFSDGTRYLVEDLQSGNGTLLNGVKLATPTELKRGDTITIGDTDYRFVTDATPIAELQTMLRAPLSQQSAPLRFDSTVEVPPPGNDTVLGQAPKLDNTTDEHTVPPGNETVMGQAPDFSTTRDAPKPDNDTVLGQAPQLDEGYDPNSTMLVPPKAQAALEKVPRRGPTDIAELDTREVAGAAKVVEEKLSAADRLREKRHAGRSRKARFLYQWKQLPRPARIAVPVTFVVLLGVLIFVFKPAPQKQLPPEPDELTAGAKAIDATFGLGDDVMYRRTDMKVFTFTPAAPTKIVGVLQYLAKDISKDEVNIAINSFSLGPVPPDTLDVQNRVLEVVLPMDQLKKGEVNQLVFDNVRNPPGEETWRIWGVRLELVAIPDTSADEAIASVREELTRARAFYDQRDIGPENLFKAWKGFREAWIKLEAIPSGRPNELYVEARSQVREVSQLLDQRCSTMQLQVMQLMSAKRPDYELARTTLEEALRYFPTREHRCHSMIREMLSEVGAAR